MEHVTDLPENRVRSPFSDAILDSLARWDRATLLRCASLDALGLSLGAILLCILLPTMEGEAVSRLLFRHVGADVHPVLVYLRLCAVFLPAYLLLAAAGLTRFSGGLCTAVLLWRGMCDGAALACLLSVATGNSITALGLSPALLLIAGTLRVLLDVAARTVLAAEAKRLANELRPDAPPDTMTRDRLRYRLLVYLAYILAATCLVLLSTGAYTLILRLAA